MLAQGHRFRLITNDAATLSARYAALQVPVPDLIEHRFTLAVPPIPFRAAHRKLELFGAFAGGGFGDCPALIDIDTVLLRPWPIALMPGELQVYDISDDLAPDGDRRFASDIAAVLGRTVADPRWWGGEFIAGNPAAFARLAAAVEQLWPAYLGVVDRLDHVGDEAVTTAALTRLREQGLPLRDIGGVGVRRWWSARTIVRPRASLREAMETALLHLPSDKPFLARYADAKVPLAAFPRMYRRHVARKLPTRHLVRLAEQLTGRPTKHVPRL